MRPPDAMERTLDRYELVERIAVGGMAEVFRAKAFGAHGFEKTLAIKRILPDLARDPEFEQRFIAEAKLAVTLTHANIVQVLDFGRFGGSLYIAMEFVDGPDLAALLRSLQERGKQFPVGAALHVAMELAKGLDFAHGRGIVHRDISPSNILLSRAGEVKIADFGIAQAAVDAEKVLSGARRIMGKWRYMSPEQARGETLGARSDLFSAGVVIYELLTGKKLFPGDDIATIVENLGKMEIAPASSVRSDLPPMLDGVLAKALERDPAKRYAQASDLLRAILEVSYSRTLVATALDVADVIAEAFPPVSKTVPTTEREVAARLIDDIIRSELLGEAVPSSEADHRPSTRVTARATPPSMPIVEVPEEDGLTTTGAAFVKKGAGPDGITLWELRTEPTGTGGAGAKEDLTVPRALPLSQPPLPVQPVGEAPDTQPVVRQRHGGGRTTLWLTLAAAGAIAAVVIALELGRGRGEPKVVAPVVNPGEVVDAARAEARLGIETTPPGATVTVDGVVWKELTPTTVIVAPSTRERPHVVQLALAGYRSFRDETVVVGAGETVKFKETLDAAGMALTVRSDPDGAEVDLDGRPLGRTPLDLKDVPADGGVHTLRLRKAGFVDALVQVKLVPGGVEAVTGTLEPAVRYGKINLYIEPWADVYLGDKKVAQAPVQGLRLPVGRQRLRLHNPVQKRNMFLYVDVPATGVRTVTAVWK